MLFSLRSLILLTLGHKGELEHRTSKARFTRTNARSVPAQLSRIEQRERRIHTIRNNMRRSHPRPRSDTEDVASNPHVQYNIGQTQNSPIHVPTFLQKNEGDPAVKVCVRFIHSFLCTHKLAAVGFSPEVEEAFTPPYPRCASARSCIPTGGSCLCSGLLQRRMYPRTRPECHIPQERFNLSS